MPRILDNIELDLLPALRATLEVANRSDFCVGYFNLRGWKAIDDLVEQWTGGPAVLLEDTPPSRFCAAGDGGYAGLRAW